MPLSACSSGDTVAALVVDGRPTFADRGGRYANARVGSVSVLAGAAALAAPTDDRARIGHGTFRHADPGHDRADRFPLRYGERPAGERVRGG